MRSSSIRLSGWDDDLYTSSRMNMLLWFAGVGGAQETYL